MSWRDLPNRQTARLQRYDYSQPGTYYVTICTRERQHFFGEVENGKMSLSRAGLIAQAQWQKLVERFPHIRLDAFVIMPNHLHGILVITRKAFFTNVPERFQAHMQELAERRGEGAPPQQAIGISHMIRVFKAATSCLVRKSGVTDFGWQSRFYESIIKDKETIQKLRHYIFNNPATWTKDELSAPPKTDK